MLGACLSIREAGLGDPAAPKTVCLPLLPSGPGGVHRVLLHRAQPLILTDILRRRDSQVFPCRRSLITVNSKVSGLGLAERVGFEPTVPLPRRMLSKHVDSSTLAPLREHSTANLSMRSHERQGAFDRSDVLSYTARGGGHEKNPDRSVRRYRLRDRRFACASVSRRS